VQKERKYDKYHHDMVWRDDIKVEYGWWKRVKIEGWHLPLTDPKACPHACLDLLDFLPLPGDLHVLILADLPVDLSPDVEASIWPTCQSISISSCPL